MVVGGGGGLHRVFFGFRDKGSWRILAEFGSYMSEKGMENELELEMDTYLNCFL